MSALQTFLALISQQFFGEYFPRHILRRQFLRVLLASSLRFYVLPSSRSTRRIHVLSLC